MGMLRFAVLAVAAVSSVILIVFAEGLARAGGFLLSASVLVAVVILDRRSPAWRPFNGRPSDKVSEQAPRHEP